jgi:hypothetical protein
MKTKLKLFCITSLCLWSICADAQLTKREIYNFSVGDTIQSHFNYHDPMQSRDTLSTVVVLAKQYAPNNDTVYYILHKKNDIWGYYMATTFSFNTDVVLQVAYTDLDTVPPGCAMLTNSCGDSTWGCPPSWSGSTFGYFTYVKSWGGLYYYYANDATVFSSNTLQYCSRAGYTCGTFMVGLQESKKQSWQPAFWPNPTTGLLHIEEGIAIKDITIYDCLSKQVCYVEGDEHMLDLSSFENGVYTLCIQSADSHYSYTKIILNK